MKRFISLFVLLLFLAVSALANCPSVAFRQYYAEDYYVGLNSGEVLGFYFTLGIPRSNCGRCDPAQYWTYPWKNGVALKGIYGGWSEWQCGGITCPRPWESKDSQRMVVVLSSPSGTGTKFVIDSVGWNQEVNAFEFNDSLGSIHEAGELTAPTAISDNIIKLGYSNVKLHIPIPKTGFFSDEGFDTKTLVVGIAVLGKVSLTPLRSLKIKEFDVLQTILVDLNSLNSIAPAELVTDVEMLNQGAGTAYYAYTLIVSDGKNFDSSIRPSQTLLPYASPTATARPMTDLDVLRSATAVDLENGLDAARITYAAAIKTWEGVQLEFHVMGDPNQYDVVIVRSKGLNQWERVDTARLKNDVKGSERVYTLTDGVSSIYFGSADGQYYNIGLTNRASDEYLDSEMTQVQLP